MGQARINETSTGAQHLHLHGHIYQKRLSLQGKTYWRCSRRRTDGCHASAITQHTGNRIHVLKESEHRHSPREGPYSDDDDHEDGDGSEGDDVNDDDGMNDETDDGENESDHGDEDMNDDTDDDTDDGENESDHVDEDMNDESVDDENESDHNSDGDNDEEEDSSSEEEESSEDDEGSSDYKEWAAWQEDSESEEDEGSEDDYNNEVEGNMSDDVSAIDGIDLLHDKIKHYGNILRTLRQVREPMREAILRSADKGLICLLCEICYNILRGVINFSNSEKNLLRPFETHIQYLASKEMPWTEKRDRLADSSQDAFIPVLLNVTKPYM
jgi:hypothetical protein